MLVSEILRIKGSTTLFPTTPNGAVRESVKVDGAERHRLADRDGPRQRWSAC
jgi:hypothetical protein